MSGAPPPTPHELPSRSAFDITKNQSENGNLKKYLKTEFGSEIQEYINLSRIDIIRRMEILQNEYFRFFISFSADDRCK